ncbi:ABC transporter permease [Paenibacillus macquariensis]|uniref:ABC-2 type transport system permease protein n=1 Tax=Paenibacillus macquariensis TaxID=948756 RepID=A0ABY1K6L9_9BACL|nr:ABC transporter permease [Paenibacillus macquariensis]MEC0093607.1 ABC transporter permease [Paenibacillus macquariensis]OAB35574.1 ABC transporter [Paenibacillus macquariensis subsp. macquariensis]SIR33280.1 ABC-2 type transport system permease protein [Paenibacillus macquariensis]
MHSLTIALNMVRRIIGTRKGFIAFIILPCVVVTATIALMGQNSNAKVNIPYVNQDIGPAGQHIIDELSRNDNYELKPLNGEKELRDTIIDKKGTLGILIPSGFSEQLLQGNVQDIRMYELMAGEAGIMVKMNVNSIVGRMVRTTESLSVMKLDAGIQLDVFSKSLQEVSKHLIASQKTDYNLYTKNGLTNVTGFTIMFMMGLVTSIVRMILDDRRNKTMARIYSAPVRSYQIAVGHMMGSFIVGILQIIIILILSRWVLGYEYNIPFFTHFLILGSFMLVAMGIASTVAGLVRNPNNASMINNMIITPTCMIGGCFWPISFMPDYMQKAANFVPQKWVIESVEKIASGGQLADIWLPLSILGLMAVILLAIGSAILRPSDTGVGV